MISAVALFGVSGLALGGFGIPVSANDLNMAGNVHASAAFQDDCVTATAGTDDAEGSVHPHQESEVQATGQGTATVAVCRDGVGGTPPGDPGDPLPGGPDNVVPDDLDDVVPDDLDRELNDIVTGAIEDGVPDDGDGFPPGDPGAEIPDEIPGGEIPGGEIPGGEIPGGEIPGGVEEDVVPGDVDGLVPDGRSLVPNLLDRLAQIIPVVPGSGPDGDGGGGPAINPSPGTASASVDAGGGDASINAEAGAASHTVLGAKVERGEPALVGMGVAPGDSLPRTGGGPGPGLLRLIAFVGLGRALFTVAKPVNTRETGLAGSG
jgi:hypothetical protein